MAAQFLKGFKSQDKDYYSKTIEYWPMIDSGKLNLICVKGVS